MLERRGAKLADIEPPGSPEVGMTHRRRRSRDRGAAGLGQRTHEGAAVAAFADFAAVDLHVAVGAQRAADRREFCGMRNEVLAREFP